MGLRLREGVDLPALANRFGLATRALIDADRFAFYGDLGFVWRDGGRIGVTEAGAGVLDALLGELVHGDLVAA